MTTLRQIELSCPICSNAFSSRAVLSSSALGGRATDFRQRTVGTQPLSYLVHTCSKCGYTAGEHDFGKKVDVSPTIRERVWDELAPKVSCGSMTGSDKYEFAARLAIWKGAGPRGAAELLLRAAWCCVDEDDVEAERYFRREAAWMFQRALDTRGSVPRDERAAVTYLVGELWRRVGNLKRARVWFDSVRNEIVDLGRQRWILDAARQQRDDPKEWFDAP